MRRISSWPIRNIRAGARLTPKRGSRKNPWSRRTPTRPIPRPANRSKAKAVRASAFSAAGATPDAESFLPAIRVPPQQRGEMHRVGGRHRGGGGDFLGRLPQLLVVLLVHRLTDPIGHAGRRQRETAIVERLEHLGGDMMGAILVADDGDQRDLAVGLHAAGIVEIVDEGVYALEHTLGDAAGLAEPDRRAEDDDVGGEQALEQFWPVVAAALVMLHAGQDVVIDGADDLAR